MKIKIEQINPYESLTIVYNPDKNDNVLLNSKQTNYSVSKFKFLVGTMTRDWPEKLENNDILDGTTYIIRTKIDDKIKTMVYKNKYPDDIYRLINLIKEVKKCQTKTI